MAPTRLQDLQIGRVDLVDKGAQGDGVRVALYKRDFSSEERDRLASEGKALDNGSYPIESKEDLRNAISLYPKGDKPKDAIRRHIIRRAKAIGATGELPDSWDVSKRRPVSDDDYQGLDADVRKGLTWDWDEEVWVAKADAPDPLPRDAKGRWTERASAGAAAGAAQEVGQVGGSISDLASSLVEAARGDGDGVVNIPRDGSALDVVQASDLQPASVGNAQDLREGDMVPTDEDGYTFKRVESVDKVEDGSIMGSTEVTFADGSTKSYGFASRPWGVMRSQGSQEEKDRLAAERKQRPKVSFAGNTYEFDPELNGGRSYDEIPEGDMVGFVDSSGEQTYYPKGDEPALRKRADAGASWPSPEPTRKVRSDDPEDDMPESEKPDALDGAPQDVLDYVEDLEKRLEEAESEPEGDPDGGDGLAEVAKNLGVDEEVAGEIVALAKRHGIDNETAASIYDGELADRDEKIDKALTVANQEREQRIRKELRGEVSGLEHIGLEHDEGTDLLKRLHDVDPELSDEVTKLFKQFDEQLGEASKLTKAIGYEPGGEPDESSPEGQLDALAKSRSDDNPELTFEEAYDQVLRENPDMADSAL